MSNAKDNSAVNDSRKRNFATTHWSMVIDAGRDDSPTARAALEKLCEAYWYPLYAFTRRQGYDANDAVDLTQGFLADLLARNDLAKVSQEKGRFRSFLLVALKHFIINQSDRANAAKRGGGKTIVSFDVESADSRFRQEPWHEETPELDFEKQWARAVLEKVRSLLQSEYYEAGKKSLYDRLQPYISGSGTDDVGYRSVASELEMSEGAVKVAIHRLRQRFRFGLRAEIANTVASEDEIDDEIQALFEALRS